MSAAAEQKLSARLVTITPQIAEQWLLRNTHNRSVVTSRVDQYAADMRRGEWRVNGEAIKLAADGTILDGQHRLLAVLEAGVEIQSIVITGLAPQAQETMDQGRARTLADVFKLRGEKFWNPLATAARAVATWELYGTIDKPAYAAPPTVQQASRTLERNPELRQSVEFVYTRHRPWLPTSHLCALHFLFASVEEEAADDFVVKLVDGAELARDSAIYVLREKLMDVRVSGETLPQRMQLALVIKAWRLYLDGVPTRTLTWVPGGPRAEPFPEIAGLERAPAPDDDEDPDAADEERSRGGGGALLSAVPAARRCGGRRRAACAASASRRTTMRDLGPVR